MSLSQQNDYLLAAQRLLKQAAGQPRPVRRALERLSASYFRRVVEDVANDNGIATGRELAKVSPLPRAQH